MTNERKPKCALKIALTLALLLTALFAFFYWFMTTRDSREYSHVTYMEHCAGCHGDHLQGTAQGSNLLTPTVPFITDVSDIVESLSGKIQGHEKIGFLEDLPNTRAKALALYIAERREEYPSIPESYVHSFVEQTVVSQHHRLNVEKYSDLIARPYSIAPLPDGRILVSEKTRGLSVVDRNGKQSNVVPGAPPAHEKLLSVQGSYVGWGHYFEVALHPDYASNGWIYLSFADRCQLDCNSALPQSMIKVIRGRIKNGEWVDEQVIWSVHHDYYTIVPDAVAGGRLAFDKEGYLYISIGGKASYKNLHIMDTPYGKVHRVRDDGSVPQDNPFWVPSEAREHSSTRHTVWSFGHRTIQGLEGHPVNGEIWGAEMGPRGGDEINKILRGENYGWPLYTGGIDYDSTEISIGKDLGLDFSIEDTVLPIVDFAPAPALSNLTFHRGSRFPEWNNDILVGSLKALSLYRLRIENDVLVEKEKLVSELGRIRDIEMGADGLVYIAIEHGDTGSIVRLVPGE